MIDGAVHLWAADPAYPWSPHDLVEAPEQSGTPDELLATIEPSGFDGAVCVQPRVYGYDHGYLIQALKDHPGRFAGVCLVNPLRPSAGEELRDLVDRLGMRGLRVLPLADERCEWLAGPSGDALWDEAIALDVAISVLARPDQLDQVLARARRSPECTLVIDHLGLVAVSDGDARASLLACAEEPNVAVKISAIPVLSAEAWPYADVHGMIRDVISAYGPQRTIFGTDWPYALEQGPWSNAFRALTEGMELDPSEHRGLFGDNARRLWSIGSPVPVGEAG